MNYEAIAERHLQNETEAYLLGLYGDEEEDLEAEEEEYDYDYA